METKNNLDISGILGYYFDKKRNRYRVRIQQKGYGDFTLEIDAQNKVKEILAQWKQKLQ